MQNYLRAVRVALQFRGAIAGAMVCSLLIAVLWGANIGALYPVLKVVLEDQSLQEWVEKDIADTQSNLFAYQEELRNFDVSDKASDDPTSVRKQRTRLEQQIEIEKKTLHARQRLRSLLFHPWMPRTPFSTVLLIIIGLMVATALKGVFIFLNSMLVSGIEQRVLFDLRRQFFHRALQMDLDTFYEERTSGMLSRFNVDVQYLATGIKNLFGSAVREPLKMTACLIGASLISWRLLAFSLILTPLAGFTIRKLSGSIKRANRRVMEEISQLYGVLTETFNGIQTVQAYTLEQNERNKFYRVSKECLKKAMKIAFYGSLTKPITEVMGIAVISLALLSGAYLTLNQETHLFGIRMCDRPIDTASILIFYGMLIGATEPARKLSEIFNSLQAGIAAADRLFPVLDQQPKVQNPPSSDRLPDRHQEIIFDSVGYHYVDDTPVLCDVNLRVQFGETIAIVGPNGCGKSTLLQLLPRFFDPIQGSVRFDDIDLRNARLKDLRQRIGLVTQQAHLFDATVFENIAWGKMGATKEEVIAASERARAHRFICEKLSDEYNTVVGSSGCRLSGGQRQRIALARAMIRNPEILILDEATSQIDIESEQLIHQAIQEFAVGRTVFLITHRLSTLALADRIVVMEAGSIKSIGTHEELINDCELYQRLHSFQLKQSA